MMKIWILAVPLLFAACRQEPATTIATDTRSPIEIAYVGAPEMQVHKRGDAASPVITTYLNGESVSLLARKGDWVEVKTAGASGWAHAADLTNAESAKAEEAKPTGRFRIAPSPVVQ